MPKKLTKESVNARIADRGIALLGEYSGGSVKSMFHCDRGHDWEARPADILRGTGCPHCSGKAKLTKEIVNQRIADRAIKLVGDYRSSHEATEFQCVCGHKWNATPASVMAKTGCPSCAGRPLITAEIVNERLRPRGIQIVGAYSNSTTKTTWRCEQGHEWEDTPTHVMSTKRGCPECTGRRIALTADTINRRIESRGITLVSGFTHSHKKAWFHCDRGHDWEAYPADIMQGTGCPHCSGKAKLTKEIVNQRIADRGIRLVGNYTGANSKALFECGNQHQWRAAPSDVMQGRGCPHCSQRALLTRDEINERLAPRGIRIIGDYINTTTKTLVEADCGHEWTVQASSLIQGIGCPYCATNASDYDTIYIWRSSEWFNGVPVYKIGVTSWRLGEKRVREVASLGKINIEKIVKRSYVGQGLAASIETELLSIGTNPNFIPFNGSTEFRALTEKQLNRALTTLTLVEINADQDIEDQ